MAALYPPYIESKLPAQAGDVLYIPFQLNRAVGKADIEKAYVHARIKTVATNTQVGILMTAKYNDMLDGTYIAEFQLDQIQLGVGEHYQLQLAFSSDDDTKNAIYFSTMGIFKYTSVPQLEITQTQTMWTGTFTNPGDSTEIVEQYRFDFYDMNDNLIETSGWLFNSEKVLEYKYIFQSLNSVYYCLYRIKTLSGYEGTSQAKYAEPVLYPPFDLDILGKVDKHIDSGSISVGFIAQSGINMRADCHLLRSCENGAWEKLISIRFNENYNKGDVIQLYEDFTIESGKSYAYALQQYQSNALSDIFVLGIAKVEFEDIFLYDGDRQLRVQFNPKVSSFKTSVLESKLNTIGGKYPVFFKNGHTAYKEFPISGLISFHMDDNNHFLSRVDTNTSRSTTPNQNLGNVFYGYNLTDEVFALERQFKLTVLDWLNNGKPKIFRSPSEGNYIIQLMGITLSPEDRLGRMLHTFNANASEIAEYNLQSLHSFKFVPTDFKRLGALNQNAVDNITSKTVIPLPSAVKLIITASAGDEFEITYENGSSLRLTIMMSPYEVFIDPLNPVVRLESITINSNVPAKIEYESKEQQSYPIDDSVPVSNDAQHVVKQLAITEWTALEASKIIYLRFTTKEEGAYYALNDTQINNILYSANGAVLETHDGCKLVYVSGVKLEDLPLSHMVYIPPNSTIEIKDFSTYTHSFCAGPKVTVDIVYMKFTNTVSSAPVEQSNYFTLKDDSRMGVQ